MSLKLIKLTKEYEAALADMIDEWRKDQEINHTNHSPWAIFKNDYHDFDYYLDHLEIKWVNHFFCVIDGYWLRTPPLTEPVRNAAA